jgi:hypothetical protein
MNKPGPTVLVIWIFLFLFLAGSGNVFSQPADNGLWTTFQLEKEITKKWSVSIEEELRLHENWSHVDRLYTEIGGSYKFLRGFKATIGYRFIEKVDPEKYYADNLRFAHRILGELSYRYHYSSFTFLLKTRIEGEMKYIYSSDKGKVPGYDWKNKFEIKYRILRIEPYAGVELRYQYTDPRHPESNFLLNRIWIYAGADFSIFRYHTIGLYYLRQHEWNLVNAEDMNVLGIQYSITLPRSGKKAKP